MRTTSTMQSVITRLIEKHESEFFQSGDERRLRLELGGYAPLLLVVSEITVAVAHEEVWNNETFASPEVILYTGGKK
jgi:hypothetical protein